MNILEIILHHNDEYAQLIVKGINSSIVFTGNFKKKMLKMESLKEVKI